MFEHFFKQKEEKEMINSFEKQILDEKYILGVHQEQAEHYREDILVYEATSNTLIPEHRKQQRVNEAEKARAYHLKKISELKKKIQGLQLASEMVKKEGVA